MIQNKKHRKRENDLELEIKKNVRMIQNKKCKKCENDLESEM